MQWFRDHAAEAGSRAVGDVCYRGSTTGLTFRSWSAESQSWRHHRDADAALFEAGTATGHGGGSKRAMSFRNPPPTNDADSHFVFGVKVDSASDDWIQIRAALPRSSSGDAPIGATPVLPTAAQLRLGALLAAGGYPAVPTAVGRCREPRTAPPAGIDGPTPAHYDE